MALHLKADRAVVTENDAFDDLIELHASLCYHTNLQVPYLKLILAFLSFSIEVHKVSGDGMNELLVFLLQGEALVDGPFEEILLISHETIEKRQFKIGLKVSVSEFGVFFAALQLQHRFNVIHIGYGAEM